MGNAFIPQGTDTSVSTEVPSPDIFQIEEAPQSENSAPQQEAYFPVEQESLPQEQTEPNPPPTARQEHKPRKSVAVHPHPSTTYTPADPLTNQIEKIMEEGIAEAYQELTPIQKQQFKIKGEETARNIKSLLLHTKVKVKKVFQLLLEWLKLLPGINRFFLMQEAKIKTDKIIALKSK